MAPNARRIPRILLVVSIGIGVAVHGTGSAAAVTDVGLGLATDFAVLAGSTVTNTGATEVSGHLGVSPLAAVTGFDPVPGDGILTNGGVKHLADVDAANAQLALTAAMVASNAVSQPDEGPPLVGAELGGATLQAGVYSFGTLEITGDLTLDGQGNQDAVFILRSAATLNTAAASRVLLIGDAQPCKVFWRVASSASLGANSTFAGTVLADQSISVGNGATIAGRLLASVGAVTLLDDTITRPTCLPAPTTTAAPTTAAPFFFVEPEATTTTSTSTTSTTVRPTTTTIRPTTTTTAVAVPTAVTTTVAGEPVVDAGVPGPVVPAATGSERPGGSGGGSDQGEGGPGDGSGITGDLPRTGSSSTRNVLLLSLAAVLVGTALIVTDSSRTRTRR